MRTRRSAADTDPGPIDFEKERRTLFSVADRGRPRSSDRLRVGNCAVLDVRSIPASAEPRPPLADRLRQALNVFGPPRIDLTVTWPDGQSVNVSVALSTTRPFYGGTRRWLQCPNCNRRCGKLFAPERRLPFLCRLCWGGVYESQYLKNPDWVWLRRSFIQPPCASRSAVRQRERRLRRKYEAMSEEQQLALLFANCPGRGDPAAEEAWLGGLLASVVGLRLAR